MFMTCKGFSLRGGQVELPESKTLGGFSAVNLRYILPVYLRYFALFCSGQTPSERLCLSPFLSIYSDGPDEIFRHHTHTHTQRARVQFSSVDTVRRPSVL